MKPKTVLLGACALLVVVACGPEATTTPGEAAPSGEAEAAPDQIMKLGFVKAVMEPLGDSGVKGTVSFTGTPSGVRLEVDVSGLTPGKHGFHIHEVGDCSAPDGSSAGGHFNPAGVAHGGPDAEVAHAGDLGNIKAGQRGRVIKTIMTSRITLGDGSATDVMGRAVIIHADPDDLTSQPSGAAGARVSCGVIRSSE